MSIRSIYLVHTTYNTYTYLGSILGNMESKTLRLIFLTWLFIISKICDADATVNDTCELIDQAFANTNTTGIVFFRIKSYWGRIQEI